VAEGQRAIGNDSGAWYAIDGRKLSGKPILPGIYIHQGRKVVVK
jgi:hypothetical protein